MKRIVVVVLGLGCMSASHAADLGARQRPAPAPAATETLEVPGGDVFGFTSAADVGNPGDTGLALESDVFTGAREGRFRAVAQKLEFSRTFAENWSYAGSLFGAWTSLKSHPDFDNRARYGFDGASVEVRHRLIERSALNPFAMTVALETRWSRLDVFSGLVAAGYGAEFKMQLDAPIAQRVFWAMNANFGLGRSRDPLDRSWATASDTSLSTGLTFALIEDKLWIGGEARWEQTWSDAVFGKLEGQALYLGPTIAFKAAQNVTLNLVALPQVAGKARGASGSLDLDNFERAKFRLKLAVGF